MLKPLWSRQSPTVRKCLCLTSRAPMLLLLLLCHLHLTTEMKQDSVRSAAYAVDCEDYVHVVEFSPFDSGEACSLIAYGGNNYVVVGTCRFQEEDAEVEGIQYKMLRTFHHGIRVDAIAWSPETRLNSLPPQIRFCTAAADRKLRLFTSDLQEKNEYKIFDGHSDYINDLVFAPKEGQVIASVGDDHTCRVWDLEGNQKAYFVLHSPGVSVCWHPEEAFKLMVAEKNGTIRFYDLTTQQAILSLESGQMPLMSADWCLKNTFRIGAVAGNDWLIWDIRYPQDKRPVHADRAKLFRWSRVNENLFATTGYPGKMSSQLLVHHSGHPQPILIGSAAVGSGLTWHRTLPLCAVGGDHKIFFWITEM
ncbi:nucleoporin Nup37 isoform X1 [Alligator mississippiensis]|uniref:nucleoporin Nup37 isoform X1 n=1 Tax=Alligator mississippiensis TaxID=8496 RepID=UPI0028774DA4|nr:nucleoporin Nup37 isoform X1 [Alligator mississippiensis]